MYAHAEPSDIAGRRVLLVEDDYFIADELSQWLTNSGAEVVGPVATLTEAVQLIETQRLDGAIVDINLRGELAYPVADQLISRGTPFVFATGYDDAEIPTRYGQVARCEKPINPAAVARVLIAQIENR